MTKPTKWMACAPSEGSVQHSLCALRISKDPRFLHADSEDSDQTGRMHISVCWLSLIAVPPNSVLSVHSLLLSSHLFFCLHLPSSAFYPLQNCLRLPEDFETRMSPLLRHYSFPSHPGLRTSAFVTWSL